jgi:hypothetical protein
MKTDKKVFWIGIVLLCSLYSGRLWGQVNVSGKSGLLYIPTAEVQEDGTFSFGVTYNPSHYAFRFNKAINPRRTSNSENIYFVNLVILPRLEVNFNLLRPNGEIVFADRGVGDRQIDIKYIVMTEKNKRPSLALILSAPFGVDNSLTTNAVIATKHLSLSKSIESAITLGFGSPYSIYRDECDCQNSNVFSGFSWKNKQDQAYRYLSGPFGGVKLNYAKKAGVMVEWDSQHLNVGGYVTLFTHWTIQAGLLDGDQFTAGTSYSLRLFQLPKRLRKHEGN